MEELKENTKRYPLVRAASEESSSELSSSPFPGDTMPWNLSKHHQIKRSKSTSGDVHVLDSAERAVLRIADERDRVQKKTFTKWVNKHLMKHWRAEAQRHITDLYEDLRDGHNLISLLEVLSGETLPREKGRMRFHKLQNVQIALDFLKHRQVKLVNIRNDDIADGNPKLTLGLIWTIILHFQISDIQVNGQSDDMTAKEKLLLWSQRMVEGYQGMRCDNFTTSWRDGKLFNAVIHKHRPTLIDMSKVYRQTHVENLEQAFSVAERDLGVTRLLDPEDVDVPHPDEKSIITYVSSLYDVMPRVPDVQDGVKANELELRWQEYYELVTLLLQWIRHHIIVFEERKFPTSYEEIEVLWRQFLKFKETELPAKEADKNRSKHVYKSFEGAVQVGHVKVPPGYHPIDVEKEWGRLHVAILERERLLRTEFERLERLQRIVSKVQMESGVCEEQLNQVEGLLQMDVRLLNSGKPAKHTAEIETDLDKAEGMIRYLFNDVQLLKDGRHLQAEQMYRRVYRLHERLVNLRSEYNLRLKSGVTITQMSQMQTLQQAPMRVRPELDEVTLRYIQDLLAWVEENQRRVDRGEWGSDLPTVESQLGSHRGLHQSVEEFHAKIGRAKADESQLSPVSKGAYRDNLSKLELHYGKLLSSSKARLHSLDGLHAFVTAATKELMWLNEKEEEEVNYDWSERNTNMTAKKDNYSGLMKELEHREKRVNSVQVQGDKLLKEGHPAKTTVEAFTAALQTQWSWILQLCCCIESHLKENTAYFQFFSDVKEAEETMKKMQKTMKKKYTCNRNITVTRLEDLLQDAADEKEQLKEFKTHLDGLNRRAKTIVQLKPRNPATPVKGKLPVQAVCDFKQMELTVHRGEECVLLDNSQPYKWKVQNPKGSKATMPSICFLVPPTNNDAVSGVSGLDTSHQNLLVLWQMLYVDMKSLMSWQYLTRDIHLISSWNITAFKTLRVEEYRLALRNLELHYQEFLRDSQDSQLFGADDRMQVESSYNKASQHYEGLLHSLEKGYVSPSGGEQDESECRSYLTKIKDLCLKLEGCETRTVAHLRQPVDKEPLKACAQRTAEQKKVQSELEGLKKDLTNVAEKTEEVLASPQQSGSTPVLRSELDITLKKMEHIYSLSSVYLDKLKTIDIVIRSTKGAEDTLKKYEARLRDVNKMPTDEKEVENYHTQLKTMRGEAEDDQKTFDNLQVELKKAAAVNERIKLVHSEHNSELEHYRQLVAGLEERWQVVFAQIDLRQQELDLLGRQMCAYHESYDWLIRWLGDAKQRQEKIQAIPIGDSKALMQQLAQEKKLLEEIEKNKDKVEECQKHARAYIDAVKDYELQVVTYKALVEPLASPLRKTKMECASDNIIQEYVTLRTRYSELMTLTSQYIKFITETQRRLEDEEKATEILKKEERKKLSEMQAELDKQRQLAEAHAKAIAKAEQEAQELKLKMKEEVSRREVVKVDSEKQKHNIQQQLHELKNLSEQEIQSKSQQVEEALYSHTKIEEEIHIIRIQLETTIKQKATAEAQVQQLRDMAVEAERLRKVTQEEAEKLRKQVNEETQKKRNAEEELKHKAEAEQEAAKQKQKALDEVQKFKMQAEEAERRMKQAEEEKQRQVMVAEEVAQKSAATELQTKRMSFNEKAVKLEASLKQEQDTVIQLQEQAERLKKQQEEANKAREEAEKELEKWRQKANEALRLRLQAEEDAHKKSQAQEEAEKQKENAQREAKKRAKAEEAALKQKEMAEKELEKQRKLAEGMAQQKLSAEQELIRLRADFDHGKQQRSLLDEELQRLKNEVNAAVKQRKELEDELAKVRCEMEVLLQMKSKAENETMSTTEKSRNLLESEALKMRQLAEEATKLRSIAEDAKKQRQVAEDEAARQRGEAEKILKEKLVAINEATCLKTEAEIALKDKEAENERLRRKAEDEAYQRKVLEDQAKQHKQDIDEKITQLKKTSDSELERQKKIVEETLKQRRVVEEEIRILKLNFEEASTGKLDLELELNKLKGIADETHKNKVKAEEESEKLRKHALEEENKRKQAEEKVKKITAAEEEAARQCQAAQKEVERLKKIAADANKQKEDADKETEKQISLAKEAAQKCSAAEKRAQAVLVKQKEDNLFQGKLKEEFEKAKNLVQEAEKAKEKAEKEAALLRQKAEDAEKQKKAAEAEAAKQAKAQGDAERLRMEAEQEAAKQAEAEAAALKQKQQADAEMAKHKKLAEQTLKQKKQVEQELTKVKLRLDETDKQKSVLDEELQRQKDEVSNAVKQKAQVEDELFKIKVQMEELIKLKLRIENENQRLMSKDKDNTQKFLEEEAENMKKLAEDAARLSLEAQEAARERQITESELEEQKALADKMLKEKMQAIQEAAKLKAEAENLQKQKDKAQKQAQKLLEDKQQMQQRFEEETEGFQKSLEAERKRQHEATVEAEKLKLRVTQLSDAQSKAEEEAKKFKKQADEIRVCLQEKEQHASEKVIVEKLEVQRLQSSKESDDLRKAIADLQKENEKLQKEAADLQNNSKEMANAQQEQIKKEKIVLEQTFLTEKQLLLKKEKLIEEEKNKLEKQFEDEVKKAKDLKDEQDRQRKQMEQEKKKLHATMDAAVKKQKDAEEEMSNKQKEMQDLEKKRLEQEKLLGEENEKLREKLQQLSTLKTSAKSHTKEMEMQTDEVPEDQLIAMTMVGTTKKVFDGSAVVDGEKKNEELPFSFDGIREKVPASRLHDIGILNKKDFDKLKKGKTTVKDLSKTEKVKTCLKGKNSVGGVLTAAKQKMSVYQAMKENKLSPGAATMLLEAQAASGFIIDPVKNRMLTVDEAVKEELIGPELHNKMLSAEKAATGYKDPYTGDKISLFEAMKKGLIEQDQAVRLLDAQIATGGIIDPVNSHRVPLQTAYKQGQLDAEMSKTLSNPTDDSKLFIDPSSQESLTYQQLLEKCTPDAETGLLMLPITEKATQSDKTYTTEETKEVLTKANISVPFGRFQGKTVTIWEIINSEYFTEAQRKDLIRQYKTGKITVEKIIKIVISVVEDKEKRNEIVFDGLRIPVTAAELLESKILNKDLFNKLHNGKTTVKEISEMDPVKKALRGTHSIAGVIIESTNEKIPFYQAVKEQMLSPQTALTLLEAQAGTGFVIDPVKNQKLTVDEAVKSGLVGPEMHEILMSAERAVNGYKDPYTGKNLSLFEAMMKDLIKKDQGIRLLEAQLATGGIIDPVKSYHIPHDVACKRGYFNDETNKTLSSNTDETKVFFDPNMWENASYVQLMKKCVTDKETGFPFLPLSEKAIQKSKEGHYKSKEEHQITEVQIKDALNQATMDLPYGPFKGRKVTIWEIINSEYITEEQRIELIRQYRTGTVTIERMITIIVTMVDEKEAKKQEKEQASFEGLRSSVTASSLFESKIIDKATYDQLQQGKKKPKEISDIDSVRKYLQGTDGQIVGIYMGESKEKVSIYQAMKKNILRQNTGLSLLMAQAATGFIIDPVKNQRYTVDDAVKAGVVGPEVHEKLLSAEKAVTGYRDPYTGNTISLFQAMKKELVLREHAIPLLEAQVATGGIIDPVSSHCVPNDVAFQRGYFNKQMANNFTDPSGDIKAFIDPNNNESSTYKQLQEKCIRDADTGLCFLPLSKAEAQSPVEKSYIYTEEMAQTDLTNTQVDIPHQSYAGKVMTLWDVMGSNLLPEEEKLRLLEQYRLGQITKERMIIIVIEIIEQREILKGEQSMSCDVIRRRVTIEELYSSRIIDLQTYNMLKQEKKTIREVMEMPSVKQYLFGTGSIAGILSDSPSKVSIYQAMKRGLIKPDFAISLLEAQAATGFIIDPVKEELLTVDEAVRKGLVGPEIHDKLLSAERAVTGYKDPYSGKVISLFQAMKKDLVPEDYALRLLEAQASTGGLMDPEYYFHLPTDVAMQRGYINKETHDRITDPNSDVQGYVDPTTEERQTYAQLLKRCKADKESGLRLLSLADRRLLFKGLRKQITLDELLRSQIIDQKTYNDLTEGLISVEEVSRAVKKYLEGTSCIAGVYVESSKDRLSIYQAMKKNMIRPGTAFELLEAQAATGYIIDPIKNLKLNVGEAVKMGVVGPEFKDKLISAERAVTGYRDPYSGKIISLFQAMKKGLILKDHGIRLLEAQIATGGIIDPEESHRLPVEMAYTRGLFDEEMNGILTDPSDDTKGFFDPNTEENLTYLQLMERCMIDPETGLALLLLKEKKRERKTSSKSSVRKRRVVIVDPETGKEMSVYEAYRKGLIDQQTYMELAEQECEWEEITITSSDGVVKSMIIDRRSGRQYDIDDAITKGLIDQSALDQYRAGTLSITEFADMLSGNITGTRSRSSSFGSTSSYSSSPAPSIKPPATIWNDPTEETVPVAGILDTDTLEKVSVTEAMHRNLVDNITGQRLLEAQACVGGIIDPNTGEKFSVSDAMNMGLVDKIMVDRINLAQKAFNGFEDPRTKKKMSAAQALKKGWLYYEAGQRFLEVQYLTGGLIEPEVTGRVPLDVAVNKGTLDARTAQKLRDVSGYSKYLTCPKTKLKISYKDAMDRSMIEEGSGLRLLEASSQSSKGLYSPYSVSGSGSASGSRPDSRTGSRSGSRRGSFDATGSGFSTNFSPSSFSSTSYGRRYNAGLQSGLSMDELAQALTSLAMGRNCSSEERIFTTIQPNYSPVA
ncbi:plectin a isoform X4 [Oncorhynchus kisutch]|uniref:plectin a isoform X4 n=1 Tax=Oncorhynchus kisutch TaxID=8019 RepID=UPI0012DD94D5|nr:plectin isoform X4 [Oncorhynchus kisutch]